MNALLHLFLDQLKSKVALLRQDPTNLQQTDLGAITFEKQKAVYDKHIQEAKLKKAEFITGGEFSSDRRVLQPTIVTGPDIENLEIYNEETFGPVVAVSTFKTVNEAIQKANRSPYGLLASVITKNMPLGEEVAKQLQVGTVTINEVVYTAGLSETPWGGVKDSGFGRTHSDQGLFEFLNIRHIHKPRWSGVVFKSLWWFPYTPHQYATFRTFLELYRSSWFSKLRAFPLFLWNFIQFIKNERRL